MSTPTQINRYQIKGELGRGGMATVFHAYDPRFQRDVAIKVLPQQFLHDPTFRARFEREAKTIAALEHPAIVPVHDFGEDNGQPYLVMRFMTGGSLADKLKHGPLTLGQASHLITRLAPALDAAHQHGLIHRDIKPANILFDKWNAPYLADFGIVKTADSTQAYTGDMVIGTPTYMSPEQAHGNRPIDGRSDIYALGIILYEILAGTPPYQADTPLQLAMKHIIDPPPELPPNTVPHQSAIQQILHTTLAKNPADRYPTTVAFAQALAAAIDNPHPAPPTRQFPTRPTPSSPSPSTNPSPPSPTIPSALKWLLPLTALIILIALIFYRPTTIFPSPTPTLISAVTIPPSPTNTRNPNTTPSPIPITVATTTPRQLNPTLINTNPILPNNSNRLIQDENIQAIAWSPNSQQIAVAITGGFVSIRNLNNGQEELKLTTGISEITSISWAQNSDFIATGHQNGSIQFWLTTQTTPLVKIDKAHQAPVTTLVWAPNGQPLLSASNQESTTHLWNATGQNQATFSHDNNLLAATWHPDSRQFALGDDQGHLHLHQLTPPSTQTIPAHNGPLLTLAWSSDGLTLASAGLDTNIHLWNPLTLNQRASLTNHARPVSALSWHPNNQLLVSGDSDQFIHLWDIPTATSRQQLDLHDNPIFHLAFAPNGTRFASTSNDETLIITNLASQ
ncbi:MAG TPA: serine/threonine-protein kinase [Anaerolineae bacterium]|nr:serine/threonine-protein kinase [Anaerolineae bacterium]